MFFGIRQKRVLCRVLGGLLLLVTSMARADQPNIEIDVLIIHTPAVTNLYEGLSGVIAHASAAVASTNQAFENSAIPIILNLVGVEEVNYTESTSSMSDDLRFITGQDENFIDEGLLAEVRDLREDYGADLVSLFRDASVAGVAGVAWLGNPNFPNPNFGYSVVSAQSAISNLVFAHEIGHNLSSAHGHDDTGNDPTLPYARGHRFNAVGTDYRTIMSIASGHTRLPHFSNPAVLFEGEPTGIPIGVIDEEADNAAAFALMGTEIENFRLTQSAEPTFLEPSLGATIVGGNSTRLNALVRGFPPLTVQWYAGEVGDTSNPLTSTEVDRPRGGTDTFIETPNLSSGQAYWIELTNPNATQQSNPIQVVVLPAAPAPQVNVIEQTNFNSGFFLSSELWQEVLPGPAYVERVEVDLARQGSPAPVQLRFSEVDGPVLAERTVTFDEVTPLSTPTTVALDVRRFIAPGRTYRITLDAVEDLNGSDRFIWGFAEDAVAPEAGIGEMSQQTTPNRAFVFRLVGAKAWSYHSWRAAEGIPFALGRGTDAAANDALPNLVRYALGFGGSEARALVEPQAGAIESINGEEILPFQFSVRRDAPDIAVQVETSTDLTEWDPLDPSRIEWIGTEDDTRDLYEAQIPLGGEPKQFVRLRVLNPPD